jgi:TRAP-type transport system small permease protein
MLSTAWKIRRSVETVMSLFLLAMVALTFADVIGRRLIGKPIYGSNDITEHLMALVVFAGLPLVTAAGAHLTIDLFDKLISKPSMAWWRVVISILVTMVLAVIAWLFVKHGLNASRISEVSQALRVPRAPLYFFMALSCALSALAALVIAFTGPMVDPEDTHEEEALWLSAPSPWLRPSFGFPWPFHFWPFRWRGSVLRSTGILRSNFCR